MTGSTTRSGSTGSGDRLTDAAGNVADRVGETAEKQVGGAVNSQLGRGADVLEQVTVAIRRSGDELRDEQPQVASLADTAADQVDKAARFLRTTDFQDLIRSTEDFARRQPAVFLGGAFALGILASRFLKASPQDGGAGSGFNRGYAGSYGRTGFGRSYGAGSYGSGRSGAYDARGYGGYGGYGGGTGSDAYGSAQANYAGSDAGPYGGDTGTRYAEPGSGDATSDEGVERGRV
jgi:hypothetical protein